MKLTLSDVADIRGIIVDKDYGSILLLGLTVLSFTIGHYSWAGGFFGACVLYRCLYLVHKDRKLIKDIFNQWKKEIMERSKEPSHEIGVDMDSFKERFPEGTEQQFRDITIRLQKEGLLQRDTVTKAFFYMGRLKDENDARRVPKVRFL